MTLNAPTVNTAWNSAGSATATSASFTPPANARLVCLITTNQASSSSSTVVSSVTSTGLTWTVQARCAWTGSAASTLPAGGTAQGGTSASIWTTTTGASPSAITVAVSYTNVGAGSKVNAQVVMFTDSSGSVPGIANASTASSASGLPSKAITASAGSYVVAARSDWADLGAGTLGTGQTALYNNTDIDYSFAGWRTTSTTSAGSVTMNMTAPSGQNYNMAVLEITAPSGGGSAGSVTAVPATATAAGVVPDVAAASSLDLTGTSASASAAAPSPTVGVPGGVTTPPATASAAASVTDVTGAVALAGVPATASAVAPAPVVSGPFSLGLPPATASAAAPAPTVAGGTGSSGSNVNAVPATATAAAAVPDVAGNDAVFSVAAASNAYAMPPTISGGTAPTTPPAATATGACVPPGASGAAEGVSVPAAASAAAVAPSVAGGGATPGDVAAVAAVASAGASAPVVTAQLPTYYVGFGGLLDLQHYDTRNVYTVNITDLSGNQAIVFFDQARTQVVPLPYTFNGVGEHLFYFAQDFQGWLSVLKNGEEIAAKPDANGPLFLLIRSEETFGYSPSRDLI